MTLDAKAAAIILVMALVAAACRLGGFAFMRFVPMSARVKAALAAMPLAVMLAIILPPALKGGWPEAAGIAATALAVLLRANEVVAVVAGMCAVAFARAIGL
jgi:uncharacterized membrane protein